MNIQNIPISGLLSGGLDAGALEQSLAASGLNGSAFADSLMAELSKLTDAINTSSITTHDLATGQAMQNFADLLGQQLPLAQSSENEIDLDETLSALKDVLEHIAAVTSMDQSEEQIGLPVLNREQEETDDKPYSLIGPLPETVPEIKLVMSNLDLLAKTQMVDAAPVKTESDLPVLTGNLKLSSADEEAVGKAAVGAQAELTGDTPDKKLSDSSSGNDKNLPKMTLDAAHLHRQFSIENKTLTTLKADVPAMSKNLADPEWSGELGDRIVWMNNRSLSAAELNLNPQHLGPVRIRIDMSQDQASITFSAQNASVREALEAAIPRLREMMSSQQLNLADVTVSQQATGDQGRSAFGQAMQGGEKEGSNPYKKAGNQQASAEGVLDLAEELSQGRVSVSQGLLSLFA